MSCHVANNIQAPSCKLTYLTFFPGHSPVPDEASVGSTHAKQNSYLKEKKQYLFLASNMRTHVVLCSHSLLKRLTQQQEVTNQQMTDLEPAVGFRCYLRKFLALGW